MIGMNNPEYNEKDLVRASVPYELKKGGVYMVEVKKWGLSRKDAANISRMYERMGIYVTFVFTDGDVFVMQPIPAVSVEQGNGLVEINGDANTDVANPPLKAIQDYVNSEIIKELKSLREIARFDNLAGMWLDVRKFDRRLNELNKRGKYE